MRCWLEIMPRPIIYHNASVLLLVWTPKLYLYQQKISWGWAWDCLCAIGLLTHLNTEMAKNTYLMNGLFMMGTTVIRTFLALHLSLLLFYSHSIIPISSFLVHISSSLHCLHLYFSGVTILLSLTVFHNIVTETLPQVSDAMPLLGILSYTCHNKA